MNQTTVKLALIDAQLLRGNPNTITTGSPVLCDTVGRVNLKLTLQEAKVTNRRSSIEQQLPSLASIELEINFPADSADPHLAAFRTAMIGRQPIPVVVGNGSEANGTRFGGAMGVFSGEDPEELTEVPVLKFVLKPWAVGYAGAQPAFGS